MHNGMALFRPHRAHGCDNAVLALIGPQQRYSYHTHPLCVMKIAAPAISSTMLSTHRDLAPARSPHCASLFSLSHHGCVCARRYYAYCLEAERVCVYSDRVIIPPHSGKKHAVLDEFCPIIVVYILNFTTIPNHLIASKTL